MFKIIRLLKGNKIYTIVVLIIVAIFIYSQSTGWVFFNGTETERYDDPDSRENLHK